MACSKYTLTNTGSTVVNFNYRRCDDSMWDYQVELTPGQTKNIWLINGTFTISPVYNSIISLVNQGPFPPISETATPTPTPTTTPTTTPTPSVTSTQTPTQTQTGTQTPTPTQTGTAAVTPTPTNTETSTQTPTPTNTETSTQTPTPTNTETSTPTPSVTATSTPTPSVTATITPSPTEPVRFNQSGICHDETGVQGACDCTGTANVWTNAVDLASSTVMFSDPSGPNTGNPEGWYVQGNIIYQVASNCGAGCTTGATISVYGVCGVTPTPTATNTSTPTQTPTQTPTPTSPLQSFSVFSGITSNQACENGTSVTIYAFNALFDQNTEFYTTSTGDVTYNMAGFYSDGASVTQLDGNGFQVGTFSLCDVLVTPTPTVTQTSTSTPTPTQTQTPTSTFAWYTYSLGTGSTANNACTAFSSSPRTIYGSIAGGVGPNVGEYLYETTGRPLTDVVPDGFYSNGTAWYQVTGGLGQITSSDPNGCL